MASAVKKMRKLLTALISFVYLTPTLSYLRASLRTVLCSILFEHSGIRRH